MAKAREAEDELNRGLWRGPLHGVPIAVKDLHPFRGTGHWRIPYRDQQNIDVLKNLRDLTGEPVTQDMCLSKLRGTDLAGGLQDAAQTRPIVGGSAGIGRLVRDRRRSRPARRRTAPSRPRSRECDYPMPATTRRNRWYILIRGTCGERRAVAPTSACAARPRANSVGLVQRRMAGVPVGDRLERVPSPK
jgi:hypothetical protein